MQLLYSLLHSQAADGNIHVIHLHGRHILNFFLNLRLELLGNGKEFNTVIQHNLYTDNNTLAVVAAAAHLNRGDAPPRPPACAPIIFDGYPPARCRKSAACRKS